MKVSNDLRLQVGVISFAYISVNEHAVHVIAIGLVAGGQVFVDAD